MKPYDRSLRQFFFDRDGAPTSLLFVVAALIVSLIVALCGGCVNVLATRNPFSDERLTETYQSTKMAACTSVVVAFPQCVTGNPNDYWFCAFNVVTIPLGVVCLCDAACEGVVDTLCLPADYFIAKSRNKVDKGK